jgi:hypothetical protein
LARILCSCFLGGSGGRREPAIGQTYRFTYEDYLAIRNEAHNLRALSPVINRETAVSDYGSPTAGIWVAPEYNQIRTVPVGTGRWLMTKTTPSTAGGRNWIGAAEKCVPAVRLSARPCSERHSF